MAATAPQSARSAIEQAIARQRAGDLPQAERLYRQALAVTPREPVANHNLAAMLAQRGDAPASLPLFAAALEAAPSEGTYWLSYARALIAAGRPGEALGLLNKAAPRGLAGPAVQALRAKAEQAVGAAGAGDRQVSLREAEALLGAGETIAAVQALRHAAARWPQDVRILDGLGHALLAAGEPEQAIAAFRKAVAADPEDADANLHLASALSEHGEIAEGFRRFMRRAALVHGRGAAAPLPAEPEHKRKHDAEQRDYLAGGRAGRGDPPVTAVFRTEGGERLEGRAVNAAVATEEMFEHWRSAHPQAVVIDDFLTLEALEALRRYCAGSTIWRRVYEAGYIGATPEDGFACPLLAQIVEEAQHLYAPIVGPHAFRYLGAFKYDSELSQGTNIHADNSAVNINLYIAPDAANLDSKSGGMRIWNVCAPDVATMRRLNSDDAAVRRFLERSAAAVTVVPHRSNRAVLFRSALFHRTDACRFREGYLNKRINVSLLFGDFGRPG